MVISKYKFHKIRYAHCWADIERIMKDTTMSVTPLKYTYKKGKLYSITFCSVIDFIEIKQNQINNEEQVIITKLLSKIMPKNVLGKKGRTK